MEEMDRVLYGLLTCMGDGVMCMEYRTLTKRRFKGTFWS